jgi:hypothetical protein
LDAILFSCQWLKNLYLWELPVEVFRGVSGQYVEDVHPGGGGRLDHHIVFLTMSSFANLIVRINLLMTAVKKRVLDFRKHRGMFRKKNILDSLKHITPYQTMLSENNKKFIHFISC